MPFKVAARTILELGAELISSDAVAIYELVKNAIDAHSPDGVTIEFRIALPYTDYVDALARIDALLARAAGHRAADKDFAATPDAEQIRQSVVARIVADAPLEQRRAMIAAVTNPRNARELRTRLTEAYAANNWIEFRDTGCGMSMEDLRQAYLVIGTPSRRRPIEAALASGSTTSPYLGEKGVGRLSAMRLGSALSVRTATATDKRYNVLQVDWSQFEDLDKLVEDIVLEPALGPPKPDSEQSGTCIRVAGLTSSWSPNRIRDVAIYELARLADPFSKQKRRFRVAILFNGQRVTIPRLDRAILDLAQARAIGHYTIQDATPRLEVEMWCGDLGHGNPPEERRILLERIDLRSLTKDADVEIPVSALRTVGPFSFELHWFNRRLLKKVDAIGERKQVLDLQAQWSGIMLFRDGYRVFPYGDDDDDWLGLDRRALASQGYKLNKAQFIGRVAISRAGNPGLIDQTNREGLKDCDEKAVLIELLRYTIQERLRQFMIEVDKRHRKLEADLGQTEKQVKTLQIRAQHAIRELEKRHSEERPQLRDILAVVDEMSAYFSTAKERAEQIEDERDRMIQLAGVGLMLEVVAHELARSTEHTLRIIDEMDGSQLSGEVAALFGTLRDEMKAMNKRLRVLDPLSVSARQRKETFDMVQLVREVLSGHEGQFRRHRIEVALKTRGSKQVLINGVRGMFVQIIENLIQNSVYWIDLRRSDEDDYLPHIEIVIGAPPILMEYTDNGPGIQPSLRDEVFKAFFSTKGKTRRQGLGLFIARDCATHHGGQLYLSDERPIHKGRLNTFILELPKATA